MNEERHVPAPLSDCLRLIRARYDHGFAPAEERELEEAASLLDLAWEALGELTQRIERCGASIELTNAVTLCSDLRMAFGNRWNARDKYAEGRVRGELERQRMHDEGVRDGLHPPVPPHHKPVA